MEALHLAPLTTSFHCQEVHTLRVRQLMLEFISTCKLTARAIVLASSLGPQALLKRGILSQMSDGQGREDLIVCRRAQLQAKGRQCSRPIYVGRKPSIDYPLSGNSRATCVRRGVCVYVSTSVYVCVCMCTCVHVQVCVCVHVCTCPSVYVCMCANVCVCVCVCVCASWHSRSLLGKYITLSPLMLDLCNDWGKHAFNEECRCLLLGNIIVRATVHYGNYFP